MTWVVWRQHRGESLITLGVLGALVGAPLVDRELEQHTYVRPGHKASPACAGWG